MKIGLIREGKVPVDKRVPFSPAQCVLIKKNWNIDLVVQTSAKRAFKDEEYIKAGVEVKEDLSDCDILMGVKEVPVEDLIANRTYLFFSHTIKKQPYNRKLLKAILEKKIRLVDYEVLTSKRGGRLVGFGRYAGIVGTYNTFRAWGRKMEKFELKPANWCTDRVEMESFLDRVILPNDFKLVLTGKGRVGMGAQEILSLVPIKEVDPIEFLNSSFDEPVYTQLDVEDYTARRDGKPFIRQTFFDEPRDHISTFAQFTHIADMYIACHYWDNRAPLLFTKEDAKHADFNLKIIGDISCDVNGPIPSTLRASTIEKPFYGYDPDLEKEVDFLSPSAIGIMAVDNLPCELPRDSSVDFGEELIKNVMPYLLGDDPEEIIERASETNFKGELNSNFAYLKGYVEG